MMTMTQQAQPKGEYIKTAVDHAKEAADFRILDVTKGAYIAWKDGRRETVSRRTLTKLQANHTWACDF